MYVPREFRAADPLEIVDAFPFATVIALPSGDATHVPVLRKETILVGHVARASPLAQELLRGTEMLAVFTGPHAYVSPFDYDAAGTDPGKHVPTWNYVATHVRGPAEAIEDAARARAILAELALRFDERGWTDGRLAPAYLEGLLRGIVAFQIEMQVVQGKEKLGQNRSSEERLSAAAALSRRPTEAERAVGTRMAHVRSL